MNKVYHFDSPREPYVCDAAVVWCFDHRFDLGFHKFLKRSGVVNPDEIRIAGGAKSLASPGSEEERQFVLAQIRASIRLHATRRVVLMTHSDCGGYGGLSAFGDDPVAEAGFHRDELRRAAAVIKAAIPEVEVKAYFLDFRGVWEAELQTVTADESAAGKERFQRL